MATHTVGATSTETLDLKDPEAEIKDKCNDDFHSPPACTKRARLKHFAQKVRQSGKELLDIGDTSASSSSECDQDIFQDAAFNPQLVLDNNKSPSKLGSLREKLVRGTKIVADAAANPKRAVRNSYTRSAAANLSKQPDNYIGIHDEELLDAHDQLFRALEPSNTTGNGTDSSGTRIESDEVEKARLRIDSIKRRTESRRNAWILSRHVVRARVFRPDTMQQPRHCDYIKYQDRDERGISRQTTNWSQYLAHLALWYSRGFTSHHIDDFTQPPFDLRELALTIKRLAVITTPWQSFIVEMRTIYTWASPRRTLRIMSFYWTLWYFEAIVPFTLISGIYLVVRNKFEPTNVESIRMRLQRTQDLEAKARALNELIQRHGNQDWIEPLLNDLGPLVQMHLEDLAGFLEVLQNFYRWERPGKTAASVFFFLTLFLLLTFISARCLLKLFWFVIGAVFFFSFPLSTNYPKYRHIVSPLCWMFWDVPNAAELAIIQLQEKFLLRQASRLSRDQVRDRDVRKDSVSDIDDLFVSVSEGEDERIGPFTSGIGDKNENLSSCIAESFTFKVVIYQPNHASPGSDFRNLAQHNYSHLTITSDGIWLRDAHDNSTFHYYSDLLEMRKLDLDTADDNLDARHQQDIKQQNTNPTSDPGEMSSMNKDDDQDSSYTEPQPTQSKLEVKSTKLAKKIHKWTAQQMSSTAMEFHFISRNTTTTTTTTSLPTSSTPSVPPPPATNIATPDNNPPLQTPHNPNQSNATQTHQNLTLFTSESTRDKIFNLILASSNLKWMPLASMGKQNRLHLRNTKSGGNKGLDDAIKRALQ